MSVWVVVAIFGLLLASFILFICMDKRLEELEDDLKIIIRAIDNSNHEEEPDKIGVYVQKGAVERMFSQWPEAYTYAMNAASDNFKKDREEIKLLKAKVNELEKKLNELYIEE